MALFGKQVDIKRIKPEPLQPAPLGSSQYVPAPRYSGVGNNAMRLADSLSSLNRSLSAFGSQATQNSQETPLSIQEATDPYVGMSAADLQKQINTENFANMGPKAQAMLAGYTGSASGTEWGQGWSAKFQDGSYVPDDATFVEVTADRQKKFQELQQLSPRVAAVFWKSTEAAYNRFVAGDQKRLGQELAGRRDNLTFKHIIGRTNDAMSGDNPDLTYKDLSAAIIQQVEDTRSVGVDSKGQQELLFDLAKYYSDKGDYELARQMLTSKRGAAGPLAGVRDWSEKVASLIGSNEVKRVAEHKSRGAKSLNRYQLMVEDGRFTQEVIDGMTTGDRELYTDARLVTMMSQSRGAWEVRQKAIARSQAKVASGQQRANFENTSIDKAVTASMNSGLGDFNSTAGSTAWIDGPNGDPMKVTMTAAEIKTSARERVKETFAALGEKMAASGASPEQVKAFVLNEMVDWSAKNNNLFPEWENKFQAIAKRASAAVVNGDELDPEIVEAANEFAEISAKNLKVAEALVKSDKDSMDWLDNYALAKNVRGQPDAQAARDATEATLMTGPAKRIAGKAADKAVDDALEELQNGGWFSAGTKSDFVPSPEDKARFRSTMRQLMVVGKLSAEDAKTHALKLLDESSIVVNGHLLSTSDKGVPKDAAELMEGALKQYPDDNPELGIESGDDLFLSPLGTGKWVIRHKDTGDLVLNNHVLTTADLDVVRQEHANQAAVEAAAWREFVEQTPGVGKYPQAVFRWLAGGFDGEGKNLRSKSKITPKLAKALNANAVLKAKVSRYVKYQADGRKFTKGTVDGEEVYVDATGHIMVPLVTLTDDPKEPFTLKWERSGAKGIIPPAVSPDDDFLTPPVGRPAAPKFLANPEDDEVSP